MTDTLRVERRHLRDAAEFARWRAIRTAGFGEWYVGPLRARRAWFRRQAANACSRLHPDFLREVRTGEGRPVAFLATVPAYWSGAPQALHELHHYDRTLDRGALKGGFAALLYWATVEVLHWPAAFDAPHARYRQRTLAGANAIVLVAMTVDPEYRGRRIPTLLLDDVRRTATRLGLEHVIAPFRPNGYGAYKAERRVAHAPELFEEYCARRDEAGLPSDPWLRVLAHNGVRFIRIEPRSYSVIGSIEAFEAYRRRHHPETWYSPAPDVWECGETPTWYVDRCRRIVRSIEPNIWGVLPVDP